jgi:hypothetical protein
MVTVADFAELAESTSKAKREAVKTLKADPSADETPASDHEVWRQCMGEMGEFVGPMLGKEGGMFKTIIAKCPPGAARAVVALAVKQFNSFKTTLEVDYGQYTVAEKPELTVLVRHVEKAVTWRNRRLQEDAQKAAMKVVVGEASPLEMYIQKHRPTPKAQNPKSSPTDYLWIGVKAAHRAPDHQKDHKKADR